MLLLTVCLPIKAVLFEKQICLLARANLRRKQKACSFLACYKTVRKAHAHAVYCVGICFLLSLILPPNYDYLYLRPRKKERERYRKKDAKKAADNFLYHRLLTVFSNIMCSMMVGHSIKLEN